MAGRAAALLLALLAALAAPALGKYVYGRGYFGTGSVKEVTKFSFRPGASEITGNVSYVGPARGSVYLFMDINWEEKFHAEDDCHKVKHAHSRIPIGRSGRIGAGIGVAEGFPVWFEESSRKHHWSFKWTISHAVRTYGWYVLIADCKGFNGGDEHDEGRSEDQPFDVHEDSGKYKKRRRLKKNQFEYSMTLLNPDGDHLPADERGLPTLYWIVTAAMSFYFFKSSGDYKRRTGNGLIFGSHAAVKAFAVAYMFQIFSMVLEIIHLWVYSYNGYGVFLFDFFSEFFEAFAQLILSFALVCLGNGWTLVDMSKRATGKAPSFLREMLNRPTLDDETPLLFIVIVLVFVSTILQIINKVQDDDFLKFHDYDGLSGKFLIFQRIVLGISFFVGIRGTIRSEEVRGQLQLETFLKRLMGFGLAWFFAFPVLVIIAPVWAHYIRHRFVTGGVMVIQSICLTLMASQLFSSKSVYSKVSEVAASGMLPGFLGGKGGKSY